MNCKTPFNSAQDEHQKKNMFTAAEYIMQVKEEIDQQA